MLEMPFMHQILVSTMRHFQLRRSFICAMKINGIMHQKRNVYKVVFWKIDTNSANRFLRKNNLGIWVIWVEF